MRRRHPLTVIPIQTAIVANRLRIPFVEIRQAIWNLDPTVLTIDRVQILLKTIPSDTEMDLLTQYAADPSRLGISEQFCLELMVRLASLTLIAPVAFQPHSRQRWSECTSSAAASGMHPLQARLS